MEFNEIKIADSWENINVIVGNELRSNPMLLKVQGIRIIVDGFELAYCIRYERRCLPKYTLTDLETGYAIIELDERGVEGHFLTISKFKMPKSYKIKQERIIKKLKQAGIKVPVNEV
jgi:hypothetical protein